MSRGGLYGRILLVHLRGTSLEARHLELDPHVATSLIGGVGLGAYLLWHHNPAGVDPLAPEAALIFCLSPLLGTGLTTTAKFAVIFKSPLTQRISDSLSSSRFALACKRLGVDAVVMTGNLDAWSHVHLHEDPQRCTVRPCPEWVGCSAQEVASSLQSRAGGRPIHVAAIGVAGEHLVRYATISNDGRHAGRGGSGAVMGSKRVKAITVEGRAKPVVADPVAVVALARAYAKKSQGVATEKYRLLGTAANLDVFARMRILPVRNFQGVKVEQKKVARLTPQRLRQHADHVRESCAGCTIACDHRYAGTRMEYETQFALGPLCGVFEPDLLLSAARACDDLGLDTISAGGTIAFAMECCERGLLAWDLGFGDDLVPWLTCIANRVGYGDLLAEGTRRMAEVVGQGAEKFACHIKGLEMPGYEPRVMQTTALGLTVAARGADHNRSGAYQADLAPGVDRLTPDRERGPQRVVETEDQAAMLDSLILCKFLRGVLTQPYAEAAEMLRAVTGHGFEGSSVREAAARTVTLRHLYNLREGWTRAEDRLADRFYDQHVADGGVIVRETLNAMVTGYYRMRGYEMDGQVGSQTRRQLGLQWTVDASDDSDR